MVADNKFITSLVVVAPTETTKEMEAWGLVHGTLINIPQESVAMGRTEPKPSASILCVVGAWVNMLSMLSFRDRSLQMLFVGRWRRLLKGRVF